MLYLGSFSKLPFITYILCIPALWCGETGEVEKALLVIERTNQQASRYTTQEAGRNADHQSCPSVALRTSCENLAHNLQKRKSV